MSAFTESFSPSSSKPQWVVQDWQNDSQINCEICSFTPATHAQICSVHDEDYVDGVLSCRLDNGFLNNDPDIAASLPYVAGSMIAAAEYAILNREVVCSPSSGSHHAGFDFGAGYCTFNSLLVAAMVMKKLGLVNRVAIIDCDRHEGDGSDQIIRHHGLKEWVVHRSQGKFFNSRSDCINGRYTRWLNKAIADCSDCDLILYQAGVDGHIDDPLGGLHTTEEMADRDRTVFQKLGHLPMVFTLAGGYQVTQGETEAQRLEPVLALHRQTARIHSELFPA
jgi:acetoin utilization deacetylase AcuC-like enzyme